MNPCESGPRPSVDIIIPTYKHEDVLIQCIESLLKQEYSGQYRIIIIDNSEIFTLPHLAEKYPTIVFLHESSPGSYNARNKGLKHTSAQLLAFTDSDCTPHPSWLEEGIRTLIQNPESGFVGGFVNVISKKDLFSAAELFDFVSGFPQERFVQQAHFAMTANMFTRRDVFDAVGDFNGAQKSGGDREWGNRVWNSGRQGVFCASAVVNHPTRGTAKDVLLRVRRVAGGARDRHPGWVNCIKFCARHALPPRQALKDIWSLQDQRAPVSVKLSASVFSLYVRFTLIKERLALQLSGGEAERR